MFFINFYEEDVKEVIPLTGIISFDIFKSLPISVAYRIAYGYEISDEDYNWEAIEEDIMSRIELI